MVLVSDTLLISYTHSKISLLKAIGPKEIILLLLCFLMTAKKTFDSLVLFQSQVDKEKFTKK